MNPTEWLRDAKIGDNVDIVRQGHDINGIITGLDANCEKIDVSTGGYTRYAAGRTTITVTLAPWGGRLELTPDDDIRTLEPRL